MVEMRVTMRLDNGQSLNRVPALTMIIFQLVNSEEEMVGMDIGLLSSILTQISHPGWNMMSCAYYSYSVRNFG